MTLPNGWQVVSLAEVTTKVGSGATPRGGEAAYKTAGVPLIRSMNIHFEGIRYEGLAYLDADQARALDGVTVAANDVLLNITGASIGRVATAPPDLAGARVNQHVSIIRVVDGVTPSFVWRWLASPNMQRVVADEESGATRQALTKEKILDLRLPLPPVNEQRRIVAKLDAIFEQTCAAKVRLERLPALFEKLKRSILAAAFRGDLSANWRAAHPNIEPSSVLCDRILEERRQCWEASLHAKGKDPKRAKYEEAAPVVADSLPDLPRTWTWLSAEQCAWEITVGHVGPMKDRYVTSGIPFLRSQNVRENRFDEEGLLQIPPDFHAELRKSVLRPGDLLVVRSGAPGTACVVPPTLGEANCADLVICRLVPSLLPDLLCFYVNSPRARDQVLEAQVGVAQQHFNIGSMRRLSVPVMPPEEQRVLLEILRSAFDAVARMEAAAKTNEQRFDAVEQAALAKAFRGELVSQDATDESASDLFDRIRAARTTKPEQPRRGHRQRADESRMATTTSSDGRTTNGHHDESLDLVVGMFQVDRRLTTTAIAKGTGLETSAVKKALKALVDGGQVRVEGKARNSMYIWTG